MKPILDTLAEIAARHLNIPTLEERHRDSLDFHDVSVRGVKDALHAAYRLGEAVGGKGEDKVGAAHTPVPWNCDGVARWYAAPDDEDAVDLIEIRANVTESGWETVAFVPSLPQGARADARRIVAAVNACEGIATKALEEGALRTIKEALQTASNYLSDDLDERDAAEMRVFHALRHALGLLSRCRFSTINLKR